MEVNRHKGKQFGKIVSVLEHLETTLDEKDEEAKQRAVLQDLFKEMEKETPKWTKPPDKVELIEVCDDTLPLYNTITDQSNDGLKQHKLIVKETKKRKASNKKKTPYSKEVVEVCHDDETEENVLDQK